MAPARPLPERRRRWGGVGCIPPLLLGLALGAVVVLVVQALAADEHLPAAVQLPADPSPDVRVTLSAPLLAALIQQSVEQGQSPIPLRNIQVATSGGRLVIQGESSVLNRTVRGHISLEPVVEHGRLRMRVVESKLGPLSVPGGIERLAEGPINARLNAALAGLPADVTSARADAAGLTVTARVRVDELPAPR